jgi:glycosyltransferase involved in cell wall biosynthesis
MSAVQQFDVIVRQTLPFARRLARLAEAEGAGVMHFNTPRGIVMAGAAARIAGLPAVMHLRGVPAISRHIWLASQALGDRFLMVAKALEKDFAPSVRSRTFVVYNGVPALEPIVKLEARRRVTAQMASVGMTLPSKIPIVVSVSSPTPFKGLHHLLRAAELLKARGVEAFFLCAGAGSGEPYETWLRESIAASSVARQFVMFGFWADVHMLLSAADLTVLPSVEEELLAMGDTTIRVRGTEGLPRAVLESFAAAVPVVASDVAGVREQVDDGVTGHVVAPGDVHALASGIEDALARPDWRRAAGAAGRQVVLDRFTIDGAARGLAAHLTELANEPPSSLTRMRRVADLMWDAVHRRT